MNSKIGIALKELRKERKLSLQEVADQIGCSASYLHRLENNSRKNPSIAFASKLAEFYDVELSSLMGMDEQEMADLMVGSQFRQEIEEEINKAVAKMTQGLVAFSKDSEESKQSFIEVQKSLLYIQSII